MGVTLGQGFAQMTVGLAPADADLLIAACAGGDRIALHRLYQSEAPRMLGIAMRFLKRRALAEEAVHDAFVNIWNHAASFDPRAGRARAWIGTIVRNRALNILRGEERTELTDDFSTFEAESSEENPEQTVLRLSDNNELKRCLGKLDEKRRHLIVLAYMHGLSHGELAERLKVPLGTMKSWIRRSLIQLRECLG